MNIVKHKIILMQSSIKITNYELGDCPDLERFFYKYNRETYLYDMYAMQYNSENKELTIPRGCDVKLIEDLIGVKSVVSKNYDQFEDIEPIRMKLKPRDQNQTSAIKFLLGRDEFNDNRYSSQLGLNLDTGAGKTYCAVAYLSLACHRGLVITTSVDIIRQWKERIYYYTTTTNKEILVISGSNSCLKLINGSLKVDKIKVLLATHSTLRNFANTYGWDKLDLLFKKLRIGTKIYDECHKDFSNLYKIDFHTNTYKTIYVSATLNRSDMDEDFIYQLYIKNVPTITLYMESHTKYIPIRFKSCPTPKERSFVADRRYGLNRLRYVKYLVENENFYKSCIFAINLALQKMDKETDKCLIYIATNEAIKIFYNWFIRVYNNYYRDIGIFTSLLNSKDKYEQLNKKFIITTTKSAGEAVDIPNLKVTMVLAEPFKSRVISKQTLGRTRDDNTYYIELVDMDFKKTVEFYNHKKTVFEKHSTGIFDTFLNQDYLDEIEEPKWLINYIPESKYLFF